MITAASEVMAILGLVDATSRICGPASDRIVVGYTNGEGQPVRAAEDLEASQARWRFVLKDAIKPNADADPRRERRPSCTPDRSRTSRTDATRRSSPTSVAMARAVTYVVTEAGFGADLGAEKFFDIKCRYGGLNPEAAVIVATVRALKMNGGVAKSDLGPENVDAVAAGSVNLQGHIENVRKFGIPPIVALNKFATDTDAEIAAVRAACDELGAKMVIADPWGPPCLGSGRNLRATHKTSTPSRRRLLPSVRSKARLIFMFTPGPTCSGETCRISTLPAPRRAPAWPRWSLKTT